MATSTGITIRLAGAASLALLAGNALAQNSTLQGSLDQPLVASGGGATTVIHENNNGDEWTLSSDGATTTVTHNGEKIPADRVRRTKNAVEVLDKNGEVIHTFRVTINPLVVEGQPADSARRRYRALVAPRAERGLMVTPAVPAVPGLEMAPPKVMVGIRMSDEDGAVTIDEVIEGTPAEKAGVESGDALVSIDGRPVKQVSDVRDALKDKNPGDAVKIVVKRDGAEKELSVTLAEYQARKLGAAPEALSIPGADDGNGWWTAQDEDRWVAEAKKQVEKAIEEIRASDALNSDKMKAAVEKSMREALAALNKAGKESRDLWRGFAVTPRGGKTMVFGGDNPDHVFTFPGDGAADTAKKLDQLSEQLDRLNSRLDDLQKRLEKLDKK